MAKFCYRFIKASELPEPVRKPLMLALSELDELPPFVPLLECSPEKADLTRKERVWGLCRYTDPAGISVVIRELSKTVSTLYHEARHYSIHRRAFKMQGWSERPDNYHIIEGLTEKDAYEAGEKGLEAFKTKYPELYQRGEEFSTQWVQDNNFSEYNDTQKGRYQHMINDFDESLKLLTKTKTT